MHTDNPEPTYNETDAALLVTDATQQQDAVLASNEDYNNLVTDLTRQASRVVSNLLPSVEFFDAESEGRVDLAEGIGNAIANATEARQAESASPDVTPDPQEQDLQAIRLGYREAYSQLPRETQQLLSELNQLVSDKLGINLVDLAGPAAYDVASGNAELLAGQLARLEQMIQSSTGHSAASHLQAYVDLINTQLLRQRTDGVDPVQIGRLGFARSGGDRFVALTQGAQTIATGYWNFIATAKRTEAPGTR